MALYSAKTNAMNKIMGTVLEINKDTVVEINLLFCTGVELRDDHT